MDPRLLPPLTKSIIDSRRGFGGTLPSPLQLGLHKSLEVRCDDKMICHRTPVYHPLWYCRINCTASSARQTLNVPCMVLHGFTSQRLHLNVRLFESQGCLPRIRNFNVHRALRPVRRFRRVLGLVRRTGLFEVRRLCGLGGRRYRGRRGRLRVRDDPVFHHVVVVRFLLEQFVKTDNWPYEFVHSERWRLVLHLSSPPHQPPVNQEQRQS